MNDTAPVNGEVLKWARESSGLSVEDVVQKMNRKRVTAAVIDAWEHEREQPSYAQLERLAYEVYKRPLALFFFPAPPEETTAKQSFRTLPEYEIQRLPTKIHFLLRKAQSLQLNLYDLYDDTNPEKSVITNDLSFAPGTSVTEMASMVRRYIGIELEAQIACKTPEAAFKAWREAIEKKGVFVFKDAFQQDEFSGFCLYDTKFPVIYLNNSKPFTRQIFTLFHELAHLLFKTGGIDTNIEDYLEHTHGNNKTVEVACNRFAGEFLVPSTHFAKAIKNTTIDDGSIHRFAKWYSVSREVILRKLYELKKIDQVFYSNKIIEWREVSDDALSKRGGGNYYFTQGTYLGEKYLEKAFSRFYQNRISAEALADYLGVTVKNIPGMESLLYKMDSRT